MPRIPGKPRRRVASSALALGLVLMSAEAMACRCMPPPPTASATLETPPRDRLVFIGRVQSHKRGVGGERDETIFDVLKPISNSPGQVVVTNDRIGHSCAFPFEVSKVYLVIGKKRPGGSMSTFKCDMPVQDIGQSALLAVAGR